MTNINTSVSIDEFQDEYVADKAAKEQAAKVESDRVEAERSAKYRAEEEAKRAAIMAKRLPIYDAIVDEINSPTGPYKSHTASFEDGRLWIDGIDCTCYVSFNEVWTRNGSRWGSKPTGKFNIQVTAGHDRPHNFPQRKDGSYNYEGIARVVVDAADRKNSELKRRRAVDANKDSVAALRTELGLGTYTSAVSASSSADKPVFVKFEISRAMTADEARNLITTLKSMGIDVR